jgi:hypothetical protein
LVTAGDDYQKVMAASLWGLDHCSCLERSQPDPLPPKLAQGNPMGIFLVAAHFSRK